MALNTKYSIVYVPLLGEGTDVWRPVPAIPVGSDSQQVFILLRPVDFDSADEDWEYLPGMMVQCDRKNKDGESWLVAASQVVLENWS